MPASDFSEPTSCFYILALHILKEFYKLNGLSGSNNDLPARHFSFQITLQYSNFTRDNQFVVLDLAGNILLLEEFGDRGRGEFTSCPGSQNGKSACIVDDQVARYAGTLQLTGYYEICKSKVYGGQADRVLITAVDGVDARLNLHGFLRVGEYVLP